MRDIILDTETTGLDARGSDRIVEIGCVELLNQIPTGKTWQRYINPERDMPIEAFRVHGLSAEFLSDKPVFANIASSFLEFLGDGRLVIHNASFDMGFINAELERIGAAAIPMHRVVDTLDLARRKHPGAQNSLDALCQRYGIDNTKRELHGALLDAQLLCEVFIELTGGRQAAFELGRQHSSTTRVRAAAKSAEPRRIPQPFQMDDQTRAAHRAFVSTFSAEPIWARYDGEIAAASGSDKTRK